MLSSSRLLLTRVASRSLVTLPARRGYAAEATTSSSADSGNLLEVSLVAPHAPVFSKRYVSLITVPGAGGYMGIAKSHVPTIAELKPGVVTVDEPGKPQEKYFVSGGFAFVHADKSCEVSVLEAFPLDQLDHDTVRKGLTQYNNEAASASDPESKAKAQIGQEVYKAMAWALGISG